MPDARRDDIVEELAEHLLRIDPQTPGQLRKAAEWAYDYIHGSGIAAFVPEGAEHGMGAAEAALSEHEEADGTLGVGAAEAAYLAVRAAVASGYLVAPDLRTPDVRPA